MEGTREPGMRSVGSYCSVTDADDLSLLRLLDKPKLNIERKRSFDERSLSDLSISNIRGPDPLDGIHSPGRTVRKVYGLFPCQPLGTLAAVDHAAEEVLNYDQVFVRDFVPSALAFLMNGEHDIVKISTETLHLQVDSGFWWIILLRAYTKATGDSSLAETSDCQKGIRLILSLCLSEALTHFQHYSVLMLSETKLLEISLWASLIQCDENFSFLMPRPTM
ncbi:unnamed protein product [Spirodela intermedia]|uniref:Alkaline/neutral invertase n=1 Tax=Spirodela intermedia TaxID=51605 RepID=A0ABN7ECE3_SPIIN|nr:unnamed protein product [Spirodela intermedia]